MTIGCDAAVGHGGEAGSLLLLWVGGFQIVGNQVGVEDPHRAVQVARFRGRRYRLT
jgi:hypothetical protein